MDLGVLGRFVIDEVDDSLHDPLPRGSAIRVALVAKFLGDFGGDEHGGVTMPVQQHLSESIHVLVVVGCSSIGSSSAP